MLLPRNLRIIHAKPVDSEEILDFLFSDFIRRDPLSVLKVPNEEARPVFKGIYLIRSLVKGSVVEFPGFVSRTVHHVQNRYSVKVECSRLKAATRVSSLCSQITKDTNKTELDYRH